jgi:hypothetical protein
MQSFYKKEMFKNKKLFFRVEASFIGIDIKKKYLKSLCYYDFGGSFKLVKMIKNKNDFLFLNEDLKLTKRYLFKLTDYYWKFLNIFKHLKIPFSFWEMHDKWDVCWIKILKALFKNKLYVLFKNFNFSLLKFYHDNFIDIEEEEINEFFQNKSLYFYNKFKPNWNLKFCAEDSLDFSISYKLRNSKFSFNRKEKIFEKHKISEELNFLEYQECYLNKLFRNLLYKWGLLYPVYFKFVKFSEKKNLSFDDNYDIKKKNRMFYYNFSYNKEYVFLINKFFYIIMGLYKKNLLIDANIIKFFLFKFKLILINLIK